MLWCSQIMLIMLQKYAIMLLIFLGPAAFSWDSMLSGSVLVLLELSEASSPESSTSSPSLETVVNLVPEAKLSDRLLVLQPGSLHSAIFSYRVTSHVETVHAQYARG